MPIDLAQLPTYRYSWLHQDIIAVFERDSYLAVINSPAFQRLADIRFLGAIDYLTDAGARTSLRRRHTRFDHTLSVAYLALYYSRGHQASAQEEQRLVLSALLHDIGHAPLSHSLEPIFVKQFGIDHHAAGRSIIFGDAAPILTRDIQIAFQISGVERSEVASMIDGTSEQFGAPLFNHPINIDTIDAIIRSSTYFKLTQPILDPLQLLSGHDDPVRYSSALDSFWQTKDLVYRDLINGPIGLLSDALARRYATEHIGRFRPEDFLLSESSLKRRHPGLFKTFSLYRRSRDAALFPPSSSEDGFDVPYKRRRFVLRDTFPPGTPNRYQQTKVDAVAHFRKVDASKPDFVDSDLDDDYD